MSEAQNVELVQRMYASLDEDFSTLTEMFAPDIEWRYPEVAEIPYSGVHRGHEGVARFFELHDEADEILDLSPNEFIAQGDYVVVLGSYRGRTRSTGRKWGSDFVHVFRIAGGKIQRFESHFNTAGFVEALHT